MRTQRWGRLLLIVMLLALLVRQQESQAAPEMQSGGTYFDDVTLNGSLDIYGAGVIRDSLDDTVQAAATSGRWTLAGNATSANLYAGATGNAPAAGLYGTVIAGGGTGSTGTWGLSGTFYNIINSQGNFSTIGGGLKNTISGGYAVIDGGQRNTIDTAGWWGVIGGGQTNRVMRPYGVVAGGYGNVSDNGGAGYCARVGFWGRRNGGGIGIWIRGGRVSDIEIEIKGLRETQARMGRLLEDLSAQGGLEAIVAKGTLRAHRYAVGITHVWHIHGGRLKNSHFPRVQAAGNQVYGVVGTNVVYAPIEHNRGGTHAFYERTAAEDGAGIVAMMEHDIAQAAQRANG